MPRVFTVMLLAALACAGLAAPACRAQNLTFQDVQRLKAAPADRRVSYGGGPQQFGELRLPAGRGPHPVALLIHGGCWYSEYDLDHVAGLAEALTRLGFATWAIEYRRIGDAGGGFPGTFEDVARGADFLHALAREYPLDLERVVAVGHSAGGQLALWLAARGVAPGDGRARSPARLRLRGVVSLAGITDMRKFGPRCGGAAAKLLGGSPAEVPERYEQTSPVELLPARVPVRLVHGAADRIVPVELGREYEAAAKKSGGDAELSVVEGAGHFELIAPQSSAWPAVRAAVLSLTQDVSPRRAARDKR
ncbi:MAG TPA: alpha/beta hydrolase [Pyrinomonadaceae bacterium]|nr:alpha/beta hydrolase [Pyrinomonadaceae bacterium]